MPWPARPAPGPAGPGPALDPATRALLDGLGTAPALALGPRNTILGWNAAATALFLDFAELPPRERTMVRLLFLEPEFRNRYADWPAAAEDAVARLRLQLAERPGDGELHRLVAELAERDADFRRLWAGHAVKGADRGRKAYLHPLVGRFELDWQALTFNAQQDRSLVVWTAPPGSPAEQALHFLCAWAGRRSVER
ncbi:hypothetical protein [Kitasatospora sp. NPDC057198]|uniref:MmyB family transcriptional regulator n=1 Tax=Kitasatospora sp. NPDC057198 TaxID=3346046 RepID=UPI00363C9B01